MSKQYTILVVDDELDNVLLLERVLRRDYNVLTASSGQEAWDILEQMDVDMIISDQQMPQMTGAELLGRAYGRNPDQVRLLLTAYSDVRHIIAAINEGHIYQYVSKPWDPDGLKLVVRRALEAYQMNLDNRRMLAEYANDGVRFRAVVAELVGRLAKRAPHLDGRTQRVKTYTGLMARELQLFAEETQTLACMCDVEQLGLLTLPDAVLNAPAGTLAPEQAREVKEQAVVTAAVLKPLPFFDKAVALLDYAGERFDGRGPRGVAGEDIPLLARVLALAVTYDSLVTGAPGQAPLTLERALAELEGRKGAELDPDLVEVFSRVAESPEVLACRT